MDDQREWSRVRVAGHLWREGRRGNTQLQAIELGGVYFFLSGEAGDTLMRFVSGVKLDGEFCGPK